MPKKYKKKLPKPKSEAEKLWDKIKYSFPDCQGTYPECPNDKIDISNPPLECKTCPIYFEYKKRKGLL